MPPAMFRYYRPSRLSDTPKPHDIYPASMVLLGQGYALWYPEPPVPLGLPQIGDVGYTSEGSFVRLFNINSEVSDETLAAHWGATFDVKPPLPPHVFTRIDRRHSSIAPGRYSSRGVQEKETRGSISFSALSDAAAALSAGYTCKEVQGALLVLQSPLTSSGLLESDELKRYMVREHERWYAHAKDTLRLGVQPEDIVLVSGWSKSSADWAVTVFSNTTTSYHASLQGRAANFAGLELFRSRKRTESGPKIQRHGTKYPRPAGAHDKLQEDQCMFVKRYRLKRRLLVVHEIVAGAGFNRLSGSRDDEGLGDATTGGVGDDGSASHHFSTAKMVDPLDVLLDYILEISDTKYAIARDEDLESIVGDHGWPADWATFLRRVQPPVLDQGTYASISIRELIAREQAVLQRRRYTRQDLQDWPRLSEENSGIMQHAKSRFTSFSSERSAPDDKWAYLKFTDASRPEKTRSFSAISPDGLLLAASWSSRNIFVWRTRDGLTVQRLQKPSAPPATSGVKTWPSADAVTAIAFSATGSHLAAGFADSSVTVWDVRYDDLLFSMTGHTSAVSAVIYTLDNARLVTGSNDGAVKIWDSRTGFPICTFALGSRIRDFVHSADGVRLFVHAENAVAVYDVTGPIVEISTFRSPVHKVFDLAVSRSGDRAVVVDNPGGKARVYDVDSRSTWSQILQLQGHSDMIWSCAYAPDDLEVLTMSRDGVLIGHDPSTGKKTFDTSIEAHGTAVSWSPDGKLIAAGGRDGRVMVWGAEKAKLIAQFMAPVKEISGLKWLPDSRRLLSYAKQGPLSLWNVGDVLRVRSVGQT
ncbi:WD40 repeat domain-containing protein [Phanerochaete sordida]|uniref:WD40 repeat domain-containing protein n=1 Tax=Phanerochaete sordida TaxID=48140 RepID=A0A9P3GEP5_9APHY|nr:WD40 repeat domain-containing protein [Phanerochaete sordida]